MTNCHTNIDIFPNQLGDIGLWYCWWKKSCTSWGWQLVYHYLQGFIHPKWLFGISEPSTVGVTWRVILEGHKMILSRILVKFLWLSDHRWTIIAALKVQFFWLILEGVSKNWWIFGKWEPLRSVNSGVKKSMFWHIFATEECEGIVRNPDTVFFWGRPTWGPCGAGLQQLGGCAGFIFRSLL